MPDKLLSPPPSPSDSAHLPTKMQVMAGMCIYFGIQIVLAPILIFLFIYLVGQNGKIIAWGTLCGLFLSCVSLLIYAHVLKMRYGVAIWSLSNQPPFRPFSAFFYGACFWPLTILLIWVGVTIVHLIFPQLSTLEVDQSAVKQLKESSLNPSLFLGTLTAVILFAPITEEILFRGLLQRMLLRRHKVWSAITQTALLFGLLHCSSAQGLRNVEIFVALFILACMQGYLYEKTQQLWAPIGLHVAFNSATVATLIYNAELAIPL